MQACVGGLIAVTTSAAFFVEIKLPGSFDHKFLLKSAKIHKSCRENMKNLPKMYFSREISLVLVN